MLLRALQLLVGVSALVAVAHAQDRCDTAQIGNMTDDAYNLEEKRVEPDMFTLEISEPDMCSDSEPVGLKVTACDSDQAPRVYLVDATRGLVVREGNLETAAYVYITVFCAYGSGETSSESSEPPNPLSRLSKTKLQSSSLPSSLQPKSSLSPSLPLSSWAGASSSMLGTSPPQPPSSLLPVESTTIPPTQSESSQSEKTIPSIQLESRFSAVSQDATSLFDQYKGQSVPIPLNLSSRGKMSIPENKPPLWKELVSPSLGKLKHTSPSDSDGVSYRGAQEHPKFYDSYELLMKDVLSPGHKHPYSPSSKDISYPSLAKRFAGSRPEHLLPWMPNRSPSWLKRPSRRPTSSLLKQRSFPVWGTRKSLSRLRRRPSGRSYDDGDSWSPYEEDPLSLHWSEERPDPFPWWTENQPLSHSVSGGPLWPKYPQSHGFIEEHPDPLLERPPPLSAKHVPKPQLEYIPSIHEEDPSQLTEWKDQPSVTSKWSKRRIIPKLLLLLQEQDHSVTTKEKCGLSHSVEDGEPWWSNLPPPEHSDDGIPWTPEYPSDYSADDGDSWGPKLSPGSYIEDSEHSPKYIAEDIASMPDWSGPGPTVVPSPIPTYATEHPRPRPAPWCPKCPPTYLSDHASQSRPHHSPSHNKDLLSEQRPPAYVPPLLADDYNVVRTERPMISSTIRHVVSWVKSSQSATSLKKTSAVPAEQTGHPQSAAPWSFLSKLLLSHPTFRDSTHVIRLK